MAPPTYSTILVYDVSRWAGSRTPTRAPATNTCVAKPTVQYCAGQFENDGSPVSTIVKGVKRAMAGEYSRTFVEDGRQEREIADLLNARGIGSDDGKAWTRGRVHQVLTNAKYVGDNVWNRVSYKLKKMRVRNAPELWVRP